MPSRVTEDAPRTELPRRKWTPEEFDALTRAGVLPEDERLELLDGELVPMTPPGAEHTNLTNLLTTLLARVLPDRVQIGSQSPIACGRARPQPDIALIPESAIRPGRFPSKALLVVEVADTSLAVDRLKAAVYAKGGVPELWIVDVKGERVEVHVHPNKRTGTYRTVHVLVPGDVLRTPALPRLKLPVARLFRPTH
jgi:Uma2 family endonuclease